jgi:thiol-disulfide isomerase/thioredoxin
MKAGYFADKFAAGLGYEAYLKTGTEEQQRRWKQFYDGVKLTSAQAELIGGFKREMKVLAISGIWCGDCVQQCPLLARIAEANPAKVQLRFVDRDVQRELTEQFRINGGDRVPVVIFLAEDFEFCGVYGDRTINRYRAIAQKKLGTACPTGIVGPESHEVESTLADWVAETERVQLMLRLSPRLRAKYGD